MRFVEPKTADQQARAVAFRTREQLAKQRTETDMPDLARDICRMMLIKQVALLMTDRIQCPESPDRLHVERVRHLRRLQTMPDIGQVTALAVETFAPPMEQFRRGRARRKGAARSR